ncbi:MAG: hypothetical protein FD170_3810 [Bacteroidetes bacterium]|nr:MAG: hypothetical protein FD170_3810 [Bacteroidota bacterium]
MTSTELKSKWVGLTENTVTGGYRSLRVSPQCICELFIGVSKENSRCLILALPNDTLLNFKGIQKENLSIEYFSEKNLIVLQLLDNDYCDLFDDLILSLYQGINELCHVDEYSNYFIQAFYRWSDFFENKKTDLLSEDAIRGLMGELLVLKSLITDPQRHDINFILSSWKGPYDKANDFELETKNLEVKTKYPSGIDVEISSEFQLELSPGKGLELIIVSLSSDYNGGISIVQLILDIKDLIQGSSGDSSILWKALGQKNINSKNIKEYEKYKFKPVNRISYNCASDNFPKLNRSNIPIEIFALKYKLRTNLLTHFIVEQKDF